MSDSLKQRLALYTFMLWFVPLTFRFHSISVQQKCSKHIPIADAEACKEYYLNFHPSERDKLEFLLLEKPEDYL